MSTLSASSFQAAASDRAAAIQDLPGGAPRVAVLGAGISGLSAAWHLRRAGLNVIVFEKGLRTGGAVGAHRADGWLHEGGPNSLFESSPEIAAFVDQIGLRPRALNAPTTAKKRFIVRRGKPVAMPASPLAFARSNLLSWPAKLRILGEPFRARAQADAEESVADFVRRRLGPEFLEYVVNPFVAGVYAGDPERLSVRHAFPKLHAIEQEHGSLIRGAIKRRNPSGAPRGGMLSFPNGLEEVPQAIARNLGAAINLGCEITRLRRLPNEWVVQYRGPSGAREETFDAVVCTLPASALAHLPLENVPAAERLRVFASVPHPAVASVFTGYERSDIAHPLDGFGMLVPQVEGRQILGTLFSSTLFPGRAPDGCVALTTFVGGMRQPVIAQLPDDALLALVHRELSALLGARAKPRYVHITRWPTAIPQYERNFAQVKAACAAVEAAAPGIFIAGNGRCGISLSNCIESGKRIASQVTEWLRVPDRKT